MPTESYLGFLIAAYAVVWVGVLLYVGSLARRNHSLERELDELKALLEKRK